MKLLVDSIIIIKEFYFNALIGVHLLPFNKYMLYGMLVNMSDA